MPTLSPALPVVAPGRPAAAPTPAGWGRRTLVLALFIVAYLGLEVASYTQRSPTYDEPLHLTAGVAALTRRDHRIDPTHPPFVRMWSALPLLGRPGIDGILRRMDRLKQDEWMVRQNTYAHDFLYGQPDPDRTVNRARFMISLLGALLGCLVFCWAEELLGFRAAVAALGMYLLSPNLGAHAALVTTDLGVSCFYFGTIYFLWRTCRACTAGNITGLALSLGLAVASKFSALLLIPTGALLLVGAVRGAGAMTWRRAAGLTGLLTLTTWLMIWAVYGFRYGPGAMPGVLLHTWDHPEVSRHLPFLAPVLEWIDARHLLPNAFTQGFLMCYAWSENLPGFLAGEISRTGWWYYYPLAFLIKTPAALLLLFAAGLGLLAGRRGPAAPGTAVFLWLPAGIYLGFSMSTGINIGVRHLLPVYPFVVLVAAIAGHAVFTAAWRARTKWLVLGPLAVWWVGSYANVYPHTLTFFNWFVGGPGRGAEYLSDSNLDWGQHLKLLKQWMSENGVDRINLAYFGMADPEAYDIDGPLLPGARDYLEARIARPELPGYVAISATVLSGVYLRPEWRLFYAGFEDLPPVAELGHTLKIYRIADWPEAGEPATDREVALHGRLGDELCRLGWFEHAIVHYEKVLARHPDDSPTVASLASALHDAGRLAESRGMFQRAVALAPDAPAYRSEFAMTLVLEERFAEAADQAQAWVRLQPRNYQAHDVLGIALAGGGRFGAAVAAFAQALRLNPGNAAIRERMELAIRSRERARP